MINISDPILSLSYDKVTNRKVNGNIRVFVMHNVRWKVENVIENLTMDLYIERPVSTVFMRGRFNGN